jgi:hypothetical protein
LRERATPNSTRASGERDTAFLLRFVLCWHLPSLPHPLLPHVTTSASHSVLGCKDQTETKTKRRDRRGLRMASLAVSFLSCLAPPSAPATLTWLQSSLFPSNSSPFSAAVYKAQHHSLPALYLIPPCKYKTKIPLLLFFSSLLPLSWFPVFFAAACTSSGRPAFRILCPA